MLIWHAKNIRLTNDSSPLPHLSHILTAYGRLCANILVESFLTETSEELRTRIFNALPPILQQSLLDYYHHFLGHYCEALRVPRCLMRLSRRLWGIWCRKLLLSSAKLLFDDNSCPLGKLLSRAVQCIRGVPVVQRSRTNGSWHVDHWKFQQLSIFRSWFMYS